MHALCSITLLVPIFAVAFPPYLLSFLARRGGSRRLAGRGHGLSGPRCSSHYCRRVGKHNPKTYILPEVSQSPTRHFDAFFIYKLPKNQESDMTSASSAPSTVTPAALAITATVTIIIIIIIIHPSSQSVTETTSPPGTASHFSQEHRAFPRKPNYSSWFRKGQDWRSACSKCPNQVTLKAGLSKDLSAFTSFGRGK